VQLDDFFTGDCDCLDYAALYDAFGWVRDMAATPQDPRYHGEGDVWTHTRMVCAALTADAEWTTLDATARRVMLTTGLLHDAGKPDVTYTDGSGRIRSPDHSRRGEVLARRLLWELEEPYDFREVVATLVRQHMQPRYLPEQKDPRRRVFGISQNIRCDLLALLARADTRGRIADDNTRSLDQIAAFVAFCARYDCLDAPRAFHSDHARFLYFRRALDDPDADVPPPAGPKLTIMSGLPGSGKDTWLARHAGVTPVISLDDIRIEIGVDATQRQKPVVSLARERAARLLAAGNDLIWNATTLGRHHRDIIIDLAAPSDPLVRIVYVEAPPSLLFPRNSARSGTAVVPDPVIWRMTNLWQPPDITEAHELTRVLHGERERTRRAS
jgi:predicted kinase